VAYFGGDWLALLDYLGESVHPDERITRTLNHAAGPAALEPRMAAGNDRQSRSSAPPGTIATTRSLPTPVVERTIALRRYWAAFDDIHARQSIDLPSLWGLVAESDTPVGVAKYVDDQMTPDAFDALLPPDIRDRIGQLWGRSMRAGFPEIVVSTVSPNYLVARAIGPVLDFWHGLALSCWFLCVSSYSRTDPSHAETYYAKQLAALEKLAAPVDRALFRDLIAVEHDLPDDDDDEGIDEASDGLLGIESIRPTRRSFFPQFRDIITQHRRAWASAHLEGYLDERAATVIADAASWYRRRHVELGRRPSVGVFGREVVDAVNTWFGGDISQLYAAIGEPCPVTVATAPRMLPADPRGFWLAFASMIPALPREGDNQASWEADQESLSAQLGHFAFRWIAAWETLGREPTLDEVGRGPFVKAQTVHLRYANYREHRSLGDDPVDAYARFSAIAKTALTPRL
jgi:hypothetical protein